LTGHVTIYGEIVPWQDTQISDWGGVNVKGVANEINSQPNAEDFIVHIHSPGGDVMEAFAIHDILAATGKKITTQIEGLCASAATIIALAGSERKMTENSEFMVHLPFGMGFGTADDMQRAADDIREVENKVVVFYAEKTGLEQDEIRELMKNETWMPVDEAKEKGFVTELITTMKAVARITPKNNKMAQMTESELDKKLDGFLGKIMEGVKKVFGRSVEMLTVTTADGTILDFGDSVEEESQIDVGSTATVDGAPATGEHVLPDGRTLVFENGAITEIREPEDDVEALKTKIATLEAENEKLKSAQAEAETRESEMKTAVDAMKTEFETFRKTIKSDLGMTKPENRKTPGENGDGTRKLYKQPNEN